MKVKASVTVKLRSSGAMDAAFHAMSQHGDVRTKGEQLTLSREWNAGSFATAQAGAMDAVHVILTHEAGLAVGSYQVVATSVEVL